MQIVVPVDLLEPKTRLSDCLSRDERRSFAKAMLDDVLVTVRASGHEPLVVSTTPVDTSATVTVDKRPLTDAINETLQELTLPAAVVMADLPLVTSSHLQTFFSHPEDVVLAPGLGGGTNAMVVRHSAFRVDYHGTSFRDHLTTARDLGVTVREADSWRLMIDIDEPDDLVEVILHGDGSARTWLLDRGFSIDAENGRVSVTRSR